MLERVHDIFLNVVQAVRAGKLRDPERLCGFVTSVARFYVYEEIDRRVAHRKRDVPIESLRPFSDLRVNIESDVYHRERAGIVRQILESLPLRDRDVLHRFYIEEQSKEEICEEMNLTPNQFRLFKSKAKAKLERLGRERLYAQVA